MLNRSAVLLLTSLLLLSTSGCATSSADFTITRGYAGPPLVGFGAQLNAYLYYGHNWGPTEANESNIADLEQKVTNLRPQHVRIFVQPEWWTGGPDIRESVIKTISLAQRAGATVNLTLWHGPYLNLPRQMRDFVGMIRDLREQHHLTCIQYLTVQNEPNSFNMDKAKYARIYHTLDEELRAAKLRDKIKIIGGDLLADDQVAWLRMLSENLSDVLDGYSIHMYQDYWDTARQLTRVNEVPAFVGALAEKGRKPLYLMEFGLRGIRTGKEEPGKHKDGRPLYETNELATLQAWRMLECLNRGYVALVWWDMIDIRYDRSRMTYGLIGAPAQGWQLKPGYHLMALFTHTARPGWRARRVEGFKRDQTVTLLEGEHGELTAYELNRSTTPVKVSISGLPPNTTFRQVIWNVKGDGQALDVGEVRSSWTGRVEITAPPSSVTALTHTF
ncbi:MAG TPA: hypothetical protein VF669_17990 [Tepidisphaeraceae bacterium]|jgi:hypothetical protein